MVNQKLGLFVGIWLWLSKPMGSHFGVGEFTTHFRTYFSWHWDVHWGYDLDFDPWPYMSYFLLLVLKGMYHKGKYVKIFVQGTEANGGQQLGSDVSCR